MDIASVINFFPGYGTGVQIQYRFSFNKNGHFEGKQCQLAIISCYRKPLIIIENSDTLTSSIFLGNERFLLWVKL